MIRKTTDMLNNQLPGWVVLIIDDVPDNLAVAKTVLKFHGADVHTASNGEDGLELLKTLRPTVILLDIQMPKMDGWAMFKVIRENSETAHVPIVAITAYAMERDREEILNMGFDGYISKPFDIFTFVRDVKLCVIQSKENKKLSEDTSL